MFLAGWGDNAQQEPLLPLHGSSSVSSRRLLIVGDPEVGKSTLLQMLCSSPSIGAGTGVSSISMNSLKTGVTVGVLHPMPCRAH